MFVPPQLHYSPPPLVSACSSCTGGCRWCTQVPSSPTRDECGLVHMYTGPLGALADEGLDCRRALKNVRGFGMRLSKPLGYCDPWHLLSGPCALFCGLSMVWTRGKDTSPLFQKFDLNTGCSGESSNDCFTFWQHFWTWTLTNLTISIYVSSNMEVVTVIVEIMYSKTSWLNYYISCQYLLIAMQRSPAWGFSTCVLPGAI